MLGGSGDLNGDSVASAGVEQETAERPGARASRHWGILALRQAVISAGTLAAGLYLALQLPPAEFAVFGYASTVFLVAAAAGDSGSAQRSSATGRADRLAPEAQPGSRARRVVGGLRDPRRDLLLVTPSVLDASETVLLVAALALLSVQMIPTSLLEQRSAFGSSRSSRHRSAGCSWPSRAAAR